MRFASCHTDRKYFAKGLCKVCYHRNLYNASPTVKKSRRNQYLKHTYGITPQQFEELLAKQQGLYALCLSKGKRDPLCVDHKHGTKLVHGLLCDSCNTKLWALEPENSDWRRKAEAYIASY